MERLANTIIEGEVQEVIETKGKLLSKYMNCRYYQDFLDYKGNFKMDGNHIEFMSVSEALTLSATGKRLTFVIPPVVGKSLLTSAEKEKAKKAALSARKASEQEILDAAEEEAKKAELAEIAAAEEVARLAAIAEAEEAARLAAIAEEERLAAEEAAAAEAIRLAKEEQDEQDRVDAEEAAKAAAASAKNSDKKSDSK